MKMKWIAVPALIVLIVWPLQAIVGALLVATLFVMAGTYTQCMMRHPIDSERLRSLDRSFHHRLIGALAVGVLFLAVWPITTAFAVLLFAVVACAACAAIDYSVRNDVLMPTVSAASAPASTDEPEFWAVATVAPAPTEVAPTEVAPSTRQRARRRSRV